MSKIIHKAISQGTIWPIIVHVSTGGKYVLISPKVLQRRRLPAAAQLFGLFGLFGLWH
jgi:hypothetical protein